jgi:predicted RNA-binding protein Jag
LRFKLKPSSFIFLLPLLSFFFYSHVQEPPSKAVVNISTVHIGRVIGKRGQTIQHLQELSGAHIELPKV